MELIATCCLSNQTQVMDPVKLKTRAEPSCTVDGGKKRKTNLSLHKLDRCWLRTVAPVSERRPTIMLDLEEAQVWPIITTFIVIILYILWIDAQLWVWADVNLRWKKKGLTIIIIIYRGGRLCLRSELPVGLYYVTLVKCHVQTAARLISVSNCHALLMRTDTTHKSVLALCAYMPSLQLLNMYYYIIHGINTYPQMTTFQHFWENVHSSVIWLQTH